MKIDDFKRLSAELHWSKNWFGKFGRPYHGGGGGIGDLVSSHSDRLNLTIYHQPSNGDTNYHEIPKEFVPYMLAVIRSEFKALAAKAIEIMEGDVKKAAAEAKDEYASLMEASGLEPAK